MNPINQRTSRTQASYQATGGRNVTPGTTSNQQRVGRILPHFVAAPEFVPQFKPNLSWVDAPEFVPRSNRASTSGNQSSRPILAPARLVLPNRSVGGPVPRNENSTSRSAQEQGSSRSATTPQSVGVRSNRILTEQDTAIQSEDDTTEDLMELSNSWNWHSQVTRPSRGLLSATPTTQMGPPAVHRRKLTVAAAEAQLCPYAMIGTCRFGTGCCQIHGDLCDLCGQNTLHPNSLEQQRAHRKTCLEQHEQDMEFSFAMAETAEKTCYICYDVIMDKEVTGDQRFGILPGCFHCYCLTCIRSWRQRAREYESRVGRSCPVCRVPSDFVIPSRFWIDNQEEKDRLIAGYKQAMSTKRCRNFDGGNGFCAFGQKCFYLHRIELPLTPLRIRTPPSEDEVENVPEPATTNAVSRNNADEDEGEFILEFYEDENRQLQIRTVVATILRLPDE